MIYVNNLVTLCEIKTFKSLTYKCLKYEIEKLDKINVNIIDIIIVLDSSFITSLKELLTEDTCVRAIFCLDDLEINNKNIKIYKTIKISNILKIIEKNPNVQPLKIINKIELNKKQVNIQFDKFSDMCLKKLNYFNTLPLPNIPSTSDKRAVYIELRKLPHSEVIIRNCVLKLGDKWAHTIITCNENYLYYLNMSKHIHINIEVINYKINSTQNEYNNLLLTTNFWNNISSEKILIYQSDSFIFKDNISDFIEWDYIGASFSKYKMMLADNQVGNGGLSLRSKSKMLEILNTVDLKDNVYSKLVNNYKNIKKLDNYPEDIIFSQNMQTMGIGKVADYETGKKFSVDLEYNDDSFGMHCMWNGCKNWEEVIDKAYNNTNKYNLHIKEPNQEPNQEPNLMNMDNYCKLMNTTQDKVLSNPKEEFRYFCFNYLDYIRLIELPIIKQNNYYEAVLIEYRCLPHLEFLIRNCIDKLGSNWSQTIICGNLNYNYIINITELIDRNIKVIKTNYDNLMPSDYSLFLSSIKFWNLLFGEKILIYQEDTCIFKYNIDEFIKWDYIGAPWNKTQNDTPNCVGNGGLSLRSKLCMLKVINSICITDTTYESSTIEYMKSTNSVCPPEDVYFSKTMQELNIGKVADWDSAYNFSSELILNENSFGGHGIWCNNVEFMKKMMYKYIICSYSIDKTINNSLSDHRGGWNIVKNKLQKFINMKSDILFIDTVDGHFLWEKNKILTQKWFGFIHLTPITPTYLNFINLNRLFELLNFKESLKKCVLLLTLSNYITDFLKKKLLQLGLNIKVFTIFHPTDTICPKFTMNNYNNNDNKKMIQIGQQLRKLSSIYLLNTDLEKVWLTGFKDIDRSKHDLSREIDFFKYKNINYDSVDLKYLNSFDDYDKLLSENIVFLDLFDAGANNSIVECISRNTPILINKLPGVVDYLGEDYPLYFNNLEEISKLTSNDNIEKTHNYLKNLNKDYLNVDNFTKKFLNILHTNLKCN
jgi:hypothetical protein